MSAILNVQWSTWRWAQLLFNTFWCTREGEHYFLHCLFTWRWAQFCRFLNVQVRVSQFFNIMGGFSSDGWIYVCFVYFCMFTLRWAQFFTFLNVNVKVSQFFFTFYVYVWVQFCTFLYVHVKVSAIFYIFKSTWKRAQYFAFLVQVMVADNAEFNFMFRVKI